MAKGQIDSRWADTLLTEQTKVLEDLRAELAKAVAAAQKVLDDHPFSKIVAAEAARQAGHAGGEASLVVCEDGKVYFETKESESVAETEEARTEEARAEEVSRRWRSHLPSLDELRQEARMLGIDPEPYGRSKVKLKEAIEGRRQTPQRKMMRTGIAFGPTTILNPALSTLASLAKQSESLDLSALSH